MVDLKCEGTSSSPTQGEGYLIVYSVSGTHSSVPSSVFDRMFVTQAGQMLMEVPISMNQNSIFNLPPPTGNEQAVNKQYADTKFLKAGGIKHGFKPSFANRRSSCSEQKVRRRFRATFHFFLRLQQLTLTVT